MLKEPRLAHRDEYATFWNGQIQAEGQWRSLLWIVLYLVGALGIVGVVLLLDSAWVGRHGNAIFGAFIAYALLVPWISMVVYHHRFRRFIRCPYCGAWFGRDVSGAWTGSDPQWKTVLATGRCVMCDAPVLSPDDELSETIISPK